MRCRHVITVHHVYNDDSHQHNIDLILNTASILWVFTMPCLVMIDRGHIHHPRHYSGVTCWTYPILGTTIYLKNVVHIYYRPPDTGFEIRAMSVWGRARYHLVTEVHHNIESLRVSGEETFCFFKTWRPGWGSNPRSPTFQGSFNHSTRAPALLKCELLAWRVKEVMRFGFRGSIEY